MLISVSVFVSILISKSSIFFIVLFGIFILNYSKDDASFSILEKKWISDNTSNIIDVSVYNDVPVYGNKGKGVIFDLLNDFTDKYKINFNKVSYLSSSSSNLKTTAFRILNSNTEITAKSIKEEVKMFYEKFGNTEVKRLANIIMKEKKEKK